MRIRARFRIIAFILSNALGLIIAGGTAMAEAIGLEQPPETAAYRELLASTNLLSGDVDPEQMVIDILPGNDDNVVDLKKVRIIVVAIMGSATLDITDINPRTISLEAETQTLVGKTDKSLCETADINDDGFPDLVCKLKTIGFRVETGEIPVLISAGTYQRESLRARGVLRYVPDN